MYFIKPGYVERSAPEYSNDADAHGFQPHVYDLAKTLAQLAGSRTVVDIGCGSGEKLAQIAEGDAFDVIGVDYGPNLDIARGRRLHVLEVDLERVKPEDVPVRPRDTIICADVIEHLVRPEQLVSALRSWMTKAAVAVLSTPERVLCWGTAHNGPPPNAAHVREWTRVELVNYLQHSGLRIAFSGFTQSHEAHPETGAHQGCQTTLVVLQGGIQ